MQEIYEMQIRSLGGEDPPEKEMATHASMLAWRIPWTEEPEELQSMDSQREDTAEATRFCSGCKTLWLYWKHQIERKRWIFMVVCEL